MTTLMQRLIETTWRPDEDDITGWSILNYTRAVLAGKKISLEIDGDGKTTESLDWRAEPFVFHICPQDVMASLSRQGMIEAGVVCRTARNPAPTTWVEWRGIIDRDGDIQMGAIIDNRMSVIGKPGMQMAVFCAAVEGAPAAPIFAVHHATLPTNDPKGASIKPIWGKDHHRHGRFDKDSDTIIGCWAEVICALFFICTPRVADVREVTHAPALQKARAKRNKPPLVEYKEIKLNVGIAPARARSNGQPLTQGEVDHGRALHRVIGHFRTYQKDREVPRVSWVPPHWRGDPTHGIVLHERTVDTSRLLKPIDVNT